MTIQKKLIKMERLAFKMYTSLCCQVPLLSCRNDKVKLWEQIDKHEAEFNSIMKREAI